VFTRLEHLTREESYGETAQEALEAFAPSYHALGYFGAGYARQVDLRLNPPSEVNIVGVADEESVRALRQAALSLNVGYRVVQTLDPARDGERLAALMLPPEPAPAAYVCVGRMCSAPISDPGALAGAVEKMRSAGVQTLD
jgi:uncharacterized protein YyaL (SSP411 family)